MLLDTILGYMFSKEKREPKSNNPSIIVGLVAFHETH
jgi:hypothetical protein